MRCIICKKTSDEIQLYTGILEAEMVMICDACAESEGIPLIKKPSESQLDKADERYSVRERMERMSGTHEATEISNDQTITQGNLAKLRTPPKKQYHIDILDDYYWTLNIARRRAKFSIRQLSEKIQIEPQTIQGIEKGAIPENFEEIFIKLEAFLGIKLLKNHKKEIKFTRTRDEEKEILDDVKKKMSNVSIQKSENKLISEIQLEKKRKQLDKLSKGEVDFSKREDLSDVTLNDLINMKKEKESKSTKKRAKVKEDAMLGDDLDLEIDEL